MKNLKKEGCPRCQKGDIALDKDQYGWYEYCLQCGYVRDLPDEVDFNSPEPREKELTTAGRR